MTDEQPPLNRIESRRQSRWQKRQISRLTVRQTESDQRMVSRERAKVRRRYGSPKRQMQVLQEWIDTINESR
jgi:hypothetical protein